jgi:hypothetical protein
MKTARYASIAMLFFCVVTAGANADPSASDSDTTTVNPYTQFDPDGIPLSVTRPQAKPLSPAELAAWRKEQSQAALDKNWLLRNYEQQLRARAGKSPDEQSMNLYYHLSSNKDLAKLAGLPAIDEDGQDSTASYRTGASPADRGSIALRADTPNNNGPATHGAVFKPLITPLSMSNAAEQRSFYSSLPIAMPSPISSGYSQTPPTPQTKQAPVSSDLEMPGMVAAEKNPLLDSRISDLTLDMLPGESLEHAKAHQDNNAKLELPLPMDANQLHKTQAGSLTARGVANTAPTPTPAPAKPVPANDEDAPLPVSKTPPISPVRSPIANPFDILNR